MTLKVTVDQHKVLTHRGRCYCVRSNLPLELAAVTRFGVDDDPRAMELAMDYFILTCLEETKGPSHRNWFDPSGL